MDFGGILLNVCDERGEASDVFDYYGLSFHDGVTEVEIDR